MFYKEFGDIDCIYWYYFFNIFRWKYAWSSAAKKGFSISENLSAKRAGAQVFSRMAARTAKRGAKRIVR